VIFMRTTSIVRPPARMFSGFAVARPAMHRSTQQLDAKAVRQHQRFCHAFRRAGEQTKRAAAVTALALRTRWHRPIGLPGSV
jgi:hypothetical protein